MACCLKVQNKTNIALHVFESYSPTRPSLAGGRGSSLHKCPDIVWGFGSIPTKQKQMLCCVASSAPTRPPRLRMGAQRYLSAPTDAPPHLLPPAHVTLPSYLATPKYINENPCETKRSMPAAVEAAAHDVPSVAAEKQAQAYQLGKIPRHHRRLVNCRRSLQDLRPT